MEFGGNYLFSAPRARVWEALNDAQVLKAAIPGCSRIEWTGESSLEVEITVNFGIIKPTFTGDLTLSNVSPAERYTLSGKGRGGMLGMAQGSADISISDAAEGTNLRVHCHWRGRWRDHEARQGADRQFSAEGDRRLLRAVRRGDGG